LPINHELLTRWGDYWVTSPGQGDLQGMLLFTGSCQVTQMAGLTQANQIG
jgi:hypothetical protein